MASPSPLPFPKYVISEALSVAISRPSCARIACDAIHLLKASTGAAGRHAPCPEGGKLRQLELSKQWLHAWMYLRPGVQRLSGAAAGEEEMDLQAWLQRAVEELVSSCSEAQAAKDSSSAMGPSSLIAWMAEMAMSLGMTAMQAGLWKECHAAMLCCFQLCSKYACPGTAAAEQQSILQLGLAPSACAAAHALLQLFQQHASSTASSLPAPPILSFLSAPRLHLEPSPADSSIREEAMARPQALVEAAQDLLASCRKTMQEQGQRGVRGTAAVAGSLGAISAVEIESLEFRAATFLLSEVGQKRALQALLLSPGLRGADLEPLAAACLERQPWRNVGIACAVMGFALRTENSAEDPDYVLIARVSECVCLSGLCLSWFCLSPISQEHLPEPASLLPLPRPSGRSTSSATPTPSSSVCASGPWPPWKASRALPTPIRAIRITWPRSRSIALLPVPTQHLRSSGCPPHAATRHCGTLRAVLWVPLLLTQPQMSPARYPRRASAILS